MVVAVVLIVCIFSSSASLTGLHFRLGVYKKVGDEDYKCLKTGFAGQSKEQFIADMTAHINGKEISGSVGRNDWGRVPRRNLRT